MERSEQTRVFKENLPDTIKNMAEVTLSYKKIWEIIINRLIDIYGDYANPEINIKKHVDSKEFNNQCHYVKKIKSIPIIEFDDIQRMIDEDEEYSNQVSRLLELNKSYVNNNANKDIILEMASILGILPDNNEGLFSILVNKKDMSNEEKNHFHKTILQSFNLLEIIVKTLTDLFIDGHLIEFDSVGSIMTQPHKKFFYRGENAYYNSSKPSLYRNSNGIDNFKREVLGRLRLYQSWETFDLFDAVRNWKNSSVNYMALSQHYGLKTQMMDITTDLKTALFFACCKFGDDRKWHPLDNSNFQHRSSRPYISKNNGNSKFGILYRSPTELSDLKWFLNRNNESSEWESVIPVGYQPFMRCSSQYAFMLIARSNSYDIYKDENFEKYRFRLTEELCNWIYNEMDCGQSIYPNADIPDISKEIESLNNINCFSKKVYDLFVEDLQKSGLDKNKIKILLDSLNISVDGTITVIDDDKLTDINNNYSIHIAEKLIGNEPNMRPMLIIPSDTKVEFDSKLGSYKLSD